MTCKKWVGSGSGISVTMVFIILKLTGVISWSWWWVLAPTWIPLVLMAVIAGFFLVAMMR